MSENNFQSSGGQKHRKLRQHERGGNGPCTPDVTIPLPAFKTTRHPQIDKIYPLTNLENFIVAQKNPASSSQSTSAYQVNCYGLLDPTIQKLYQSGPICRRLCVNHGEAPRKA
jgi:hypothetical protein